MVNLLDYRDLQIEGFTGTAWNVYYEFGRDDEWWGHSGEYADELDAWFKDLGEAMEFVDECYPDEVLEEKLLNSPDSGGADKIMLGIRSWEWIDGVDEMDGDEEYFVILEKDGGEVSVVERNMP